MTHVIFSIDKDTTVARAAFTEYLRSQGVPFDTLVGCYKGTQEVAWIMHIDAFGSHVRHRTFVQDQESVLLVTDCNKHYATLEFNFQCVLPQNRKQRDLGSMHEVSEREARANGAWTYSARRNIWWIAKAGNPDRVPPPAGWPNADTKAEIKQHLHDIRLGQHICGRNTNAGTQLGKVALFLQAHFGVKE